MGIHGAPDLVSRSRESAVEEALIVALRRHRLLPLADCRDTRQATVPHLARSSLHRHLRRHDSSPPPDTEGDDSQRSRLKRHPIGCIRHRLAEMRAEAGKLHPGLAIGRASKLTVAERHEKATRRMAGGSQALAAAVPECGTQLADPSGDGCTPSNVIATQAQKVPFRCQTFEAACARPDIAHRLTKPRLPVGRLH